jgi:integrase
MTDFNLKKYRGDRTWVSLKSHPGVSRIWVWDTQKEIYVSPINGSKYLARKNGASRQTKMFATKEEASAWLRGELALEQKSEIHGYTIRDLTRDWQRLAWPSFRESTKIFYTKVLKLFKPIEDVEVEKLTPAVIDQWLSELKSPTYLKMYRTRRSSVIKELDCLKTMVNWYIECHDDTKLVIPFKKRHAKMAMIKEAPRKQCRYMTSEEYQRWLAVLKVDSPLYYALALVQTRQLLRVSEVCAMKWSNLDLQNRSYRLCEHVIWPRVGGKSAEIALGTKNMRAGEIHHLPLRQDVAGILSELKEMQSCDLIFHDNGQVLSYRQVQHRYNSAFKKAGLPYSSTHVCRHTGATAFLNETGDYLALQQMGNWTDLKVALHYGKVLGSRAKEAVAKAEKPKLKLVTNEAI